MVVIVGDLLALYLKLKLFNLKVILQSLLLTIFLSITFLSCERAYDVDDIKKNSLLVLSSFFMPDSNLIVQLSSSRNPYFDEAQDSLINIKLKLINKKDTFSDFVSGSNGSFILNESLEKNVMYSIIVNCDNFKKISASSFIPEKFDSLSFTKQLIVNSENENNIKFVIKSSKVSNSFLILRHIILKTVKINDELISFKDTAWIQPFSDGFEQILPTYASTKTLFSNIFRENEEISFLSYDGFDINNSNLIKGISVIELFSCSEDYYNYQKDLTRYNWNNKNINSSIINTSSIFSNVKNGFGIFAGFNKYVLRDTFK